MVLPGPDVADGLDDRRFDWAAPEANRVAGSPTGRQSGQARESPRSSRRVRPGLLVAEPGKRMRSDDDTVAARDAPPRCAPCQGARIPGGMPQEHADTTRSSGTLVVGRLPMEFPD